MVVYQHYFLLLPRYTPQKPGMSLLRQYTTVFQEVCNSPQRIGPKFRSIMQIDIMYLQIIPMKHTIDTCSMRSSGMNIINKSNKKTVVPVTFRTIAHFFDPDDPTPENARELSERAESCIAHAVAYTKYPLQASRKDLLEIHLPASDLTPEREKDIVSAVRAHFLDKAENLKKSALLTQRKGFREFRLTVAVCIPAFIGMVATTRFPHNDIAYLVQNILVIVTWVVIWQPFQSLVFDRWNNAVEAKICRQIAGMEISIMPD